MSLRNQKGQFVFEAILLMIVAMSISLFVIRSFRENQVLATIVETPWDRTSGMIEAGVWATPAEARSKIPYQTNRMYTPFQHE